MGCALVVADRGRCTGNGLKARGEVGRGNVACIGGCDRLRWRSLLASMVRPRPLRLAVCADNDAGLLGDRGAGEVSDVVGRFERDMLLVMPIFSTMPGTNNSWPLSGLMMVRAEVVTLAPIC